MNSSPTTNTTPLIQLFHNQLFEELESHRIKQLELQDEAAKVQTSVEVVQEAQPVTTQSHLLFPEAELV